MSKGNAMNTRALDALHSIHTATNDVLKGYAEMSARAEPEIQPVIRRLCELHERHAGEQAAELALMHDAGKVDASLQGTVNEVVVTVRDWISGLGLRALPAVRQGEESLRDEYDKVLRDGQVSDSPAVAALLAAQVASINDEIARLPPH